MEYTSEEMLQLLEMLQVPKEAETKCRDLLAQDNYPEMYRYLRSLRGQFLEDLHVSQNRLDKLDHLIYEVKKNKIKEQKSPSL